MQIAPENDSLDWGEKPNSAFKRVNGPPGGGGSETNGAAEGKDTTDGKEMDVLLGGINDTMAIQQDR